MTTFSKTLLGLLFLVPLTACPSDDEPPQPEGPVDFPIFDACKGDVDSEKDGVVDARWTYTYKDGNYLKDSLDNGLDGTADETFDYVFSGDDMTRFEWRIAGEDGQLVLQYVSDMTYDTDGRLLTNVVDDDGDGVADTKTISVRDDEGRLLETQTDTGNDGTIDAVTKHVYDAEGVRTHSDIDGNKDGTADGKITYSYNAEGRLARTVTDRDLDGTPDRIATREYGSHGFRSHDATDFDADGVFDSEFLFGYADGKSTTQENISRSAEGEIHSLSTYSYDCGDEKPSAARVARMADIRADIRAELPSR